MRITTPALPLAPQVQPTRMNTAEPSAATWAPATATAPIGTRSAAVDAAKQGARGIVVEDASSGRVIPTGPGTKDREANDAATNAGVVLDFYRAVFGRDSIDGAGMLVKLQVHDRSQPGNASWDGQGIQFGDGDGVDFRPLTGSLDAVGHELTHGVNQFSNGLVYRGQSGALDESFSDVMGEAAQIWHEKGSDWGTVDVAKSHVWTSGEDGVTGTNFDAISDLANPDRDRLVLRQPAHMKDFLRTGADNGGVHTNSGIPSHAAYQTAVRIGVEKMAHVWYDTMTKHMKARSTFADAAAATIESAKLLYGVEESNAVRDAWAAVGL